ncbi:hypothetical protein PVAP13_1NG196738, partial [Panicum virgatum]
MAGSDSSIRGGHHGEQEHPVARAELHQLQNSLLEAMERMFNERLLAAGGRGPHQEESGDENSGFGNGFHDHFGNGHGGHGGGRRAGHNDRRARGERRYGRRVHIDDEDEIHRESKNGEYDDNDNPFADHGHFGQHRDRRRGASHDGGHHHGRHNRDDPDSIARVKLSVLKFSGREDADAYLEWEEQ